MLLGAVQAEPSKPITMGAGEWQPFVSQHLPNYGLLPSLMSRAYEFQNMAVQYDFHPWMRTETLAANGQLMGAIGYVKNQSRLEKFIYSEQPLYSVQQAFFHLADRPVHWRKLSDLKGYVIGITQGYWYGETFNQAVKNGELDTLLINDELQGMKMLAAGRIDLLICESSVGQKLLQQLDHELQNQIKANQQLLESMDVYAIFSRKHPGAEFYKRAFDSGMKKLHSSGEYQKIINQFRLPAKTAQTTQKNSPVSN